MKELNQRKYLDVPSQKEIIEQFNEIKALIQGITTFQQVKEFSEKYPDIEVEINGEEFNLYNNEELETVRFEYKNILVYLDIEDNQSNVSECITVYDDDGEQFADCKYFEFHTEVERVANMGLLKPNPNFNKFKAVLHLVELESGLDKNQIFSILNKLEDDDNGYMPIEVNKNNSSAYGFICSSYYEELNYDINNISCILEPVLDDWRNESISKIYKLKDGTDIYMGCDCESIICD